MPFKSTLSFLNLITLFLATPTQSLAFSKSFRHHAKPSLSDSTDPSQDGVSTVASSQKDDNDSKNNNNNIILSRRDVWNRVTAMSAAAAAVVLTGITIAPSTGRAACLYGDPSPDCIGVYKVPLDDEFLPYMDTPEKLKTFAPDVRWVQPVEYPKSYADAVTMIKEMRDQCEGLCDIVLKGDLEEAGVHLLTIIPKVTVSGRVILHQLHDMAQAAAAAPPPQLQVMAATTETAATTATSSTDQRRQRSSRRPLLDNVSMKSYRVESAHTELLATLGQCDVLIGQARSGQLGAITLAQIHILADIREALEHFDDMLRAVPETV